LLSSIKNQMIAKAITRFPSLAERFLAAYQPVRSEGVIPWSELGKPLRTCKMAVVTTAGVHHDDQQPFDMRDPDGDPSYRELDGTTIRSGFTITHDYYDHTDAERDLNIVLPLDRLDELTAEGLLDSLSVRHSASWAILTAATYRPWSKRAPRKLPASSKKTRSIWCC